MPAKIFKLNNISQNSFIAGHILGGINSPSANPFNANQNNTTTADASIYAVRLTRTAPLSAAEMDGKHNYEVKFSPNPATTEIRAEFYLNHPVHVQYFITDSSGRIVAAEKNLAVVAGDNRLNISLPAHLPPQVLTVTMIFDKRYYFTQKIVKTP